MFIELLSLIAGASAIFAAFEEGRKWGNSGTLIGLTIGIIIGFVFWWGARIVTKVAIKRLELFKPKLSPLRLLLSWLLCVLMVMWMILSSISASWITRLAIHLVVGK
jgi:ABC-type lipoprotein release transport system permease subunit